jgi:hypothetical protein
MSWLGWLLVAAVLWFGQATVGAYANKPARRIRTIRWLFTIGSVLAAVIGIVRLVGWIGAME